MMEEFIWVEIELQSGDSVTGYNGQMSILDYFSIENGTIEKPFIKLNHIHWYKINSDDEWKHKELIEYGKGKYAEYDQEALIRVDLIYTIFRLKHGPKLDDSN